MNELLDAYKHSLRQSVEHFAIDYLKDNDLEFLVEPEDDSICYVDNLYQKDKVQALYLFSDDKVRRVILTLENGKKVINSTTWKTENIKNISLTQESYDNTIMVITFSDEETITLDANNVFGRWSVRASKAIKEIYKKYS